MKKFFNLKIIIPVAVILILFLGMGLYLLLAPETWWKPVYVRLEMNETPTPEGQTNSPEAAMPSAEVASTQTMMPSGAQPFGQLQSGQPSGIMYELESKVVNLAEPGGLRYLQTSIVLELWPLIEGYYSLEGDERTLAEEEFQELIDARRPMIDDILTTTLSSKTFNDIATVEGKQKLKEELTETINEALGYQAVINVYFTNFVIQ